MKTKRIINGAFWAALAVILCTLVVLAWSQSGCQTSALFLAVVYYCGVCLGLGLVVDYTIKEHYKIF